MPKLLLTDIAVKSLTPPAEGQIVYWDTTPGVPGFGCRISQGGARTFILKRDNRRHTLGRYPTVSLQQARKEAQKRLARRTLGFIDTTSERFEDAFTTYDEVYIETLRASTAYEKRRLFKRNIAPFLGAKKLHAITPSDVSAVTDRLRAYPTTAIHVHKATVAFFAWCVSRHLIERSPCEKLHTPGSIRNRSRVLSDKELAAVYRAALHIGHPFGTIVIVCIHTGMRRTEAASLKWSYLTPETITLPPEITKNHTELVLPNMLHDDFERLPRGGPFLFPTANGTPFNSWSKSKARLDRLSGVTGYGIHDLRRTFSTIHGRIGTPPHVTEAMLNHITGVRTPIQRVYDRHDYLPQMYVALTNYGAELQKILAAHPCSAM